MGEPEPERCRQTKQKLRRPQGAGIWPEAVPRNEGQIRIMTFLDSTLQVYEIDEDNHQRGRTVFPMGEARWKSNWLRRRKFELD
jgi:hypothetical protein